jgi:uncharacterized membrane protein YidH (DUF202 family)
VESQYERTRLAWRRTILALVVIGGLGAIHLATANYLREAGAVIGLTVIGVVPAIRRLRSLRNRQALATWEPAVLTVAACLMALSVLAPA